MNKNNQVQTDDTAGLIQPVVSKIFGGRNLTFIDYVLMVLGPIAITIQIYGFFMDGFIAKWIILFITSVPGVSQTFYKLLKRKYY